MIDSASKIHVGKKPFLAVVFLEYTDDGIQFGLSITYRSKTF